MNNIERGKSTISVTSVDLDMENHMLPKSAKIIAAKITNALIR